MIERPGFRGWRSVVIGVVALAALGALAAQVDWVDTRPAAPPGTARANPPARRNSEIDRARRAMMEGMRQTLLAQGERDFASSDEAEPIGSAPSAPASAPSAQAPSAPPALSAPPPTASVRGTVAPTPPPIPLPQRERLEPAKEPPRPGVPELRAWTQPGLCAQNLTEAEGVRRSLEQRFRVWNQDAAARIFVDPRLPVDAAAPIARQLTLSWQTVTFMLGLDGSSPDTFVYADADLLRASACVNGDVVAFYDGALHVVASDRGLVESVTHELAHHALITSGLRGPAWAQEGLAMLTAGENWWRDPARLRALASNSLPLESMEAAIPYKLPKDQAITFYVQAAAMVSCVVTRKRWPLRQIVQELHASPDAVADVPELTNPSELFGCVRGH